MTNFQVVHDGRFGFPFFRLPDSSSREPEVFLPLSNTSLRFILLVAGSEKTSGIQGSGLEMLFKYFVVK